MVAFGRKKYFNDSSLAEQIAFTDDEGIDIPLLAEWEAEELEFYTMKGKVCQKFNNLDGIKFYLKSSSNFHKRLLESLKMIEMKSTKRSWI